jgi:hypothetical protein
VGKHSSSRSPAGPVAAIGGAILATAAAATVLGLLDVWLAGLAAGVLLLIPAMFCIGWALGFAANRDPDG